MTNVVRLFANPFERGSKVSKEIEAEAYSRSIKFMMKHYFISRKSAKIEYDALLQKYQKAYGNQLCALEVTLNNLTRKPLAHYILHVDDDPELAYRGYFQDLPSYSDICQTRTVIKQYPVAM